MPSACTKPDNKASNEASDPLKQVLVIVDKKVRNLEKRKGKLEGYKEKKAQGVDLNKDQQEAVDLYDAVLQNLEFTKELHKQFSAIQVEAEKLLKKQAKRETHERQQQEIRRIKEILAVQNLLDSMGSEEVRQDFVKGTHGAVQLSEENLNNLDELYKLISPSREGEVSYEDQLSGAADHIVNFLDGKEKEVIGTTYKSLKSLVDKVAACGYFDKKEAVEEPAEEEEAPAAAAAAEEETTEAPVVQEEEPVETSIDPANTATENAPLDNTPANSQQAPVPEQQQQQQQQQPPVQHMPTLDFGIGSTPNTSLGLTQTTDPNMVGAQPGQLLSEEETFFSTTTFPRQRQFSEIVSSVQGSFNFLQDSEIEQQKASKAQAAAQQLDPAVVAAQMAGSAPGQETSMGYHQLDSSAPPFQSSQSQVQSSAQPQGMDNLAADPHSQSSSSTAAAQYSADLSHQAQQSQYAADQTAYAQTLMTQSLQQNTAQQFHSDQPSFGDISQQMSQHNNSGAASAEITSDSGPQPIPLPGQYNSEQDKSKKPFSMNPNANIFNPVQSMLPQSASGGSGAEQSLSSSPQQQQSQDAADPSQATASSTAPQTSQDKQQLGSSAGGQTAWSSEYQSTGTTQQQDGYNQYRGGQRGGMDRGNYRGGPSGRGMNNGYRGGNRGSGMQRGGRGGGYSGSRGEGQNRGGPRGSGAYAASGPKFQGFPQRNDYHPEGGYQSYNNGFMASGGGSVGGGQGGRGGGPRGAGQSRGDRGGYRGNGTRQ